MTLRERELEREIKELRDLLEAVEVRQAHDKPRNIYLARTGGATPYPPENSRSNTVYPLIIQDGSYPRVAGTQVGSFQDHTSAAKVFATALSDTYLTPNTKGIAFELSGYWWFIPECRAEEPDGPGAPAELIVRLRPEYSIENGCLLRVRLWDSHNANFPDDFNNWYTVTVYDGILDTDPILAKWEGPPGEIPQITGWVYSEDPREGDAVIYIGWPSQVLVRIQGYSDQGFFAQAGQTIDIPTPTKPYSPTLAAYADPAKDAYINDEGDSYATFAFE